MLNLKEHKSLLLLVINFFILINLLPLIVFIWLMLFGLDGITERQWFAAWMTVGIAILGLWARWEVMLYRRK